MKPEERMREFAELGEQGVLCIEDTGGDYLDGAYSHYDVRAREGAPVAFIPGVGRENDIRNAQRVAYMADAGHARLIADVIEAARIVVADADRPQEGHLRDMLARLDAYDGERDA